MQVAWQVEVRSVPMRNGNTVDCYNRTVMLSSS
ncbi:protein of unknown function [Kyrpidia spormannii]|uniref:Uncharacterized protein n=1 Tax=Kyrpidia spormannii TaxID=2055160 RepID=A0ACA8ZC15_9BACL|nr:protein of unknown function [Kyrpidia spormannii]